MREKENSKWLNNINEQGRIRWPKSRYSLPSSLSRVWKPKHVLTSELFKNPDPSY